MQAGFIFNSIRPLSSGLNIDSTLSSSALIVGAFHYADIRAELIRNKINYIFVLPESAERALENIIQGLEEITADIGVLIEESKKNLWSGDHDVLQLHETLLHKPR
jgi:hypothetical protein